MTYVLVMISMAAGITYINTLHSYPTQAACESVRMAHDQDRYADKRGKVFECRAEPERGANFHVPR
jgi:hypothetical protein